jgi:hypothetical protein
MPSADMRHVVAAIDDRPGHSGGGCTFSKQTPRLAVVASAMGQELISTGAPTGIERQKRLVRYCRGYLRPSACVVPLNWP